MKSERLTIAGLQDEIDICVDRWGVPHIRAGNLDDLFFGQGFNAARDRMWQIDLARKRGLGLLAADFGPGFLAQDRAARLFLYRGDMEAEWAAYGPDAKRICTCFAQGINAYIDLIAHEPSRLPPEFVELGSKPDKWRPEDVVRIRTHARLRNATSEVLRARVLATAASNPTSCARTSSLASILTSMTGSIFARSLLRCLTSTPSPPCQCSSAARGWPQTRRRHGLV